jgi:DNA recombination protein RmuC
MATWILIGIFGLIIVGFCVFLLTKQQELSNSSQRAMIDSLNRQQDLINNSQKTMNEGLQAIMKTVNENLARSQTSINQQMANTGAVVSDIQKKLGVLETTAKNMQDIGKDISSLQDILKAPKLRGNLGEFLLEDLLKQMFPAQNYEMQYSFKDGTKVDAIIKLGANIVPIDSKFPMESFQRIINSNNDEDKKKFRKEFVRSVKLRIDEIADNYIKPAEGTYEFAMMYIPAENVFYETIINDTSSADQYEIFSYAISRHVIATSPNSFYAYLMAIAYGLRGFKIEQKAKEMIGEFSKVQGSFTKFYDNFSLVGRHISNASGAFDKCEKEAEKFNTCIGELTGNKMELPGPDNGR